MTYSPPPYSGPEPSGQPPAGWPPPPQAPPPEAPSAASMRRSIRPATVVIAVLAVALVAVTTMWLVAVSNNGALLEKNEALLADAAQLQATRDAVPDLKAVAQASFGSSAYFYGDAESVTVTLTESSIATAFPQLRTMLDKLGFSEAVISRMGQTRALDGTQSAEGRHCNVTWTYHPDDGLQAVFEADRN